jgi:hypothetical protein
MSFAKRRIRSAVVFVQHLGTAGLPYIKSRIRARSHVDKFAGGKSTWLTSWEQTPRPKSPGLIRRPALPATSGDEYGVSRWCRKPSIWLEASFWSLSQPSSSPNNSLTNSLFNYRRTFDVSLASDTRTTSHDLVHQLKQLKKEKPSITSLCIIVH